jgi:hypothetical protein
VAVVVAHNEAITRSLIVFGGVPPTPSVEVAIAPASVTEWTTESDPDACPRPRRTSLRLNDGRHATH